MATAKLTERQKEIKALLDKGQTPDQAAKRLKISTNAIYQQVRRMRASGVKIELPGNTGSTAAAAKPKTRAAAKSRRQSGGQSRRTAQRAARPAPAPKPQTAEELLHSEVEAIDAGLAERTTRIAEAEAIIALTREEIAALEVERTRKLDVIAVLTGEKVAHAKPKPPAPKPAAKRSNGAKGGTTQAEAAETPQNGAEAPQTGDESLTQAQREATGEFEPERAEAEAASAAAEAPQETAVA